MVIVRRGTGRAEHTPRALLCSMKTNKAIFKGTLNKKGSSNKNGELQGSSTEQLIEESLVCHREILAGLSSTLQIKTPKLIYLHLLPFSPPEQ